jgi:CRISPR-associated protein Cmr5
MSEQNTVRKKLENGRALFAYECAEKGSKSSKPKEYKSYVKKIPMLIKTNGLGATYAFIKSKGGTYDIIYNQTSEWLKKDEKNLLNLSNNTDLVRAIIDCESDKYRAVTVEVLAFFNWLRRFAEGLIED